jgi:HEAT repeat protein
VDKDSVPALMQALADKSAPVWGGALDLLIPLKDERAAEALADKLPAIRDRAKVTEALIAIGGPAEKPALKLLAHRDRGVRGEACKILKAVGTKESIPDLKKAGGDKQLKAAADDAVKAIEARK